MSDPTYPSLPGAAAGIRGGYPPRQSIDQSSDCPIPRNQGTDLPDVPINFKIPALKILDHSNKDPAAWDSRCQAGSRTPPFEGSYRQASTPRSQRSELQQMDLLVYLRGFMAVGRH